MTLLLGGSVLLIGGSAVALVLGWLNANETYIWTSIGATAAAAVLLVVAFLRSRKEAPAAATAPPTAESLIDPEILADREERATQKYSRATTRGADETEATAVTPAAEDEVAEDDDEDDESDGTPAPGTVVTSTGLGTAVAAVAADDESNDNAAGATAATVGPPAGGADATASVVAIPKTKKFHSLGCRFASAKGAETMDRASAVERGYQPCGVCKP